MPRPRPLLGLRVVAPLCAVALLFGACTSSGASGSRSSVATTPAPSGSVGATACQTAPAPTDTTAWSPPAAAPALLPVLVTNDVVCGKARILVLYLDTSNKVVSAPDRSVKVTFYDLGRDPARAVTSADGAFVWTIPNDRGMYILDVDLPEAGTWGAEFSTQAPGSTPETVRLTFDVHDSTPTIRVGQPAPASKTPTLADVGGDVSKISTDPKPDPAFYSTSVADALAAHKPFMLIFATPKFCTSAQCGPTLDRFKPVAAANPNVTFINVEPYQLHDVDGQLQPVLDPNNNLQATDVTNQWGLLTEPWIFAVDRTGIVRGSYEVAVSDSELETVIGLITAAG